jgi:hypothetical protein
MAERDFEHAADEGIDEPFDDDGSAIDGPFAGDEGEDLPPDALDELAAVTDAETDALDAARAALDDERERTRAVLARYREALLAAEPDLPPDLVRGESLEELDASMAAARSAVAEIRERLTSDGASAERGFPVGAPARTGPTTAGLSASEKIRRGLAERGRG